MPDGKHLVHRQVEYLVTWSLPDSSSHAHEEDLPGTVNLRAAEGDDTGYVSIVCQDSSHREADLAFRDKPSFPCRHWIPTTLYR